MVSSASPPRTKLQRPDCNTGGDPVLLSDPCNTGTSTHVSRAVTGSRWPRDRSAETPERVAGDRLGVSRAQPAAGAAHPDRRVGRVERHRIAVDLELLVHRVRDDGSLVAEQPHVHVLAD